MPRVSSRSEAKAGMPLLHSSEQLQLPLAVGFESATVEVISHLCCPCLQVKKDHGCNLGSLIPSLQRLLSFGLQSPTGAPQLSTAPPHHAPADGVAPAVPQAAAAAGAGQCPTAAAGGRGGSYVPPHLRRASAEGRAASGVPAHQEPRAWSSAAGGSIAEPSAVSARRRLSDSAALPPSASSAPPRGAPGSGSGAAPSSPQRAGFGSAGRGAEQASGRRSRHSTLDSSDSEVSDSEGPGRAGGGAARAARVRAAVLAVLQILAKADSKALHASWTTLLPTSEAVRTGLGGGKGMPWAAPGLPAVLKGLFSLLECNACG
jgi:hypothetical protein